MNEFYPVNRVLLTGRRLGEPLYSHECRGIRFYRLTLGVERLSGREDCPELLLRENQLPAASNPWLSAEGELRSYNNRSGKGRRLELTVLVRSLTKAEPGESRNELELRGTLCKEPIYRLTPRKREICDFLLAVNRSYGRSDYLPCIAWGVTARRCGELGVGAEIAVRGRIQSRGYKKLTAEGSELRVAYELSCSEVITEL